MFYSTVLASEKVELSDGTSIVINTLKINSDSYKDGNKTQILATMNVTKDGLAFSEIKINGYYDLDEKKFIAGDFCPYDEEPCFNARYFSGENYRAFEKHLTRLPLDQLTDMYARCFVLSELYDDFQKKLKTNTKNRLILDFYKSNRDVFKGVGHTCIAKLSLEVKSRMHNGAKYIELNIADCKKIENNEISLNFSCLYNTTTSEPFSKEYVYTEGANKPAFEKSTVGKFYVGDLNNDSCSDIFFDYADSAAEPFVLFGNKNGKLKKSDIFEGHTKIRTIREAKFDDINGDGLIDIIGFSNSHYKKKLGWGFYEPEFIALGTDKGKFTVLENNIETDSHAGLLEDLDHDGKLDILPLNQIDKSHSIEISGLKIQKGSIMAPNTNEYSIFDADAADLNGDGLIDVVLSVMPNHRANKYVSPERLNKSGSLLIYFGDRGIPLSKIKPVKIGNHWLSEADWKSLLKSRGAKVSSDLEAEVAPSNADLIDLDGDGDLDILVGYFFSHKSSWKTSGFQIYENKNGVFSLATKKFVPSQPTNRGTNFPTDFILDFYFEDIDRDGNKDLILSHMGLAHQSNATLSASIFLNRDGKFFPVSLKSSFGLPDLGRREQHIVPGDFNCDGETDFATLTDAQPNFQQEDLIKLYLARTQISVPLDLFELE